MHSNKASIIIALVILTISIFLLIVYSGKQGKYTFSFMGKLYEEIRTEKKVSKTPHSMDKAFAYAPIDAIIMSGILPDPR